MKDTWIFLLLAVFGGFAAFFACRAPASGKVALALTSLPAVGIGMATFFC